MSKGLLEISATLFFYSALIASVLASVTADPRIDADFNNENQVEYHYRYSVDDSESKGPVMDRWEQRIGEYVKGAYSVVEPDGRVRTVDYEVDGKKGYHAVIRMNEPGPDLLSYQQLQKSFDLYPDPIVPASIETPSTNLSPPDPSTGKAWNYHSETRFMNDKLGPKPESSAAEIPLLPKPAPAPRNVENLPLSPANFNVPQTTNLIYFKTPTGSIFQQPFRPKKPENFILRAIKTETFVPVLASEEEIDQPRRRRYSKLVRRYKSFAEVNS